MNIQRDIYFKERIGRKLIFHITNNGMEKCTKRNSKEEADILDS